MKYLYAYNTNTHEIVYSFTTSNEKDFETFKPLDNVNVCVALDAPIADLSALYIKNGSLYSRETKPQPFHIYKWNNDLEIWEVDIVLLKEEKSKEINSKAKLAIVSGFKSAALGTEHYYPSNLVDQQNLNSSVVSALLEDEGSSWATPFWCANQAGEWAFVAHSVAQIKQAGKDAKAHVLTQMNKSAELQAQIQQVDSFEALSAIQW